jgi:hypothetical protein
LYKNIFISQAIKKYKPKKKKWVSQLYKKLNHMRSYVV